MSLVREWWWRHVSDRRLFRVLDAYRAACAAAKPDACGVEHSQEMLRRFAARVAREKRQGHSPLS